ncbi:MAG TPA: helix-turn-helix domain-containing protein [Bacillota bacterium]|nr:helix-turn-helix domain-containing protein [Bacillota bacterium]
MPADIKYLTIEDVSEMLQVTRTTIYNFKKRGMPFIKLGKTIRFDQDEVIDWIKANNERTVKQEE